MSNDSCSSCAFTFCAHCLEATHAPASCAMVREWKRLGGYFEAADVVGEGETDDASSKLLQLITKKCTTCGMRLTKNGGGIHFTCMEAAGGCGHLKECCDGVAADFQPYARALVRALEVGGWASTRFDREAKLKAIVLKLLQREQAPPKLHTVLAEELAAGPWTGGGAS